MTETKHCKHEKFVAPYDDPVRDAGHVQCANTDCGLLMPVFADGPLGGDGPCTDCGGPNIVWHTENVLWNAVCRQEPYVEPTLCVHCFVIRAEKMFQVTGWLLLPGFSWIRR